MASEPLRVACIGMGWWSDVLADAMKRSDKLKIVADAVYANNRAAALNACRRALTPGWPSRADLSEGLKSVSNPFFTPKS